MLKQYGFSTTKRVVLALVGALVAVVVMASPASAIYKGYRANPSEFPWLVTVTYKDQENCGGALVAPSVAVTAAHCVQGDLKWDRVVFGYKSKHPSTVKIRRVAFNNYDPHTNRNDIALVFLDWQPPSATPIDLVQDDPAIGTWLTAVGFGCSAQPYLATPKKHCKRFPNHLQGVSLQRVRQDCRKMSATDFCVTGGESGTNHGDSGGPVMEKIGETWKLAGLVDLDASGTELDDSAPFFDDVTSIAQQAQWINSEIAKDGARAKTWRLTALGIGPLRLGMSEAEARATGTDLSVSHSGGFCNDWTAPGLKGVWMFALTDSGTLRSIGLYSRGSHGPAGVEVGDSIAKLKARLGSVLEPVKAGSFFRQQHLAFYRIYSRDRSTTLQFAVNTKKKKVTAEEAGYPGEFYYPDGYELCA